MDDNDDSNDPDDPLIILIRATFESHCPLIHVSEPRLRDSQRLAGFRVGAGVAGGRLRRADVCVEVRGGFPHMEVNEDVSAHDMCGSALSQIPCVNPHPPESPSFGVDI